MDSAAVTAAMDFSKTNVGMEIPKKRECTTVHAWTARSRESRKHRSSTGEFAVLGISTLVIEVVT